MSDIETEFHKQWLGMVQPTEGLVVSVPVLVQAEAMRRLSPGEHHRFLELCQPVAEGSPDRPIAPRSPRVTGEDPLDGTAIGQSPSPSARSIASLDALLEGVLELRADLFDRGDRLPPELRCDVVEGHQTLTPTLALRRQGPTPATDGSATTPAALAGSRYVALVWDLPDGLELDKPETTTGPWHYPPSAKFDRLLRECRVPIGLLTNRRAVRLVYAPHGESTGSITFRVNDMASVGGRPIFDAFVMLLSATRFFGVAEERQLPALLRESRLRQANVTTALAEQVFEALELLLAGFEAAAERDGPGLLRDAREREDDHLYGGLLTVLLRLVFVLYAEDRGLLPVESKFYSEHLSVLALHEQLQRDHGLYPDSMQLRFGAWGRLVTLFRAVFLGVEHGDLALPARRGDLFDPHRFPFLEGWGPGGSAPITLAEDRAAVRVPTVSDGTIYEVLHRLQFLEGQRLSYRALDVEQIGSVYEALMGYHVVRLDAPAVCVQPRRAWVEGATLLAAPQREAWLQDEAGLGRAQATKLAAALKGAKDEASVLEVLDGYAVKGTGRAPAGRLVLQPGAERRRTSSHYTPRSLSAPIVRRTLEPLLAAMKPFPTAKGILDLKICDPAMGSGAFLVEACRFLADQLVAAWSREGQLERIAAQQTDVLHHARRLVAQRCLYGVDKNPFAVGLAKLSLWLATLARELPFTFLDHALRCGDSLVGLSFEQIKAFDWRPPEKKEEPKETKGKKKPKTAEAGAQLELFGKELEQALSEAIELRQRICDLASDPTPEGQREKERLLQDAEDAMNNVRIAADVCVGAFFTADKAKARVTERDRRQLLVERWLRTREPPTPELLGLQEELHRRVRPFHWGVEFPEVFYVERPDPLDAGRVNRQAWMDAFVGNPPFAGINSISEAYGRNYVAWLQETVPGDRGNRGQCDVAAYFFRRADVLLGSHGAIGLLATKTISQGDTRRIGLKHLVNHSGMSIYDAVRSMPWPGEAAVFVAIVHMARGTPMEAASTLRLDGRPVTTINSRLRPKPERPDPAPLAAHEDLCLIGCKINGDGFMLTTEEHDELIRRDRRNGDVISPYIGGDEINSSPTQTFDRYVINFRSMPLEEAERWPDVLAIVREKVKPERDSLHENSAWNRDIKKRWWQHASQRPVLQAALAKLNRCLVTAQVTKHLCFSFQPVNRVLSQKVVVLPFQGLAQFAVLQSRVHEYWVRLLSPTLEDRLSYSPSDCFDTFPLPTVSPSDVSDAQLEDAGHRLYETRAEFMQATGNGLTKTYNMLKDGCCADPRILQLRTLHEEMDRAVLQVYAKCAEWPRITVPPYIPTSDEERVALENFEDEVIDHLFQLNARRAAAEAKDSTTGEAESRPRRRRKTKAPEDEAEMFEA